MSGRIFIAGTGRSGTTWLADIVRSAINCYYMFEPFNPRTVPEGKEFGYRQYLRPECREERYLKYVRRLFAGNIKNKWIDKFNCGAKSASKLIKDIRANHLLKWLKVNFPETEIILLLRHPCAVAHSKMKLKWETHIEEFFCQDELVEDFLVPFKSQVQECKTEFEKHILLWCIENYVPLQQFEKNEICLVHYEDLCVKPEEEIKKIFSFVGCEYSDSILKVVKKPSSTCRGISAIIKGNDLINDYKNHVTEEQIKRSVQILEVFGMRYPIR